MPKVGAIILAGGGSRRMGRDKAWIDIHGETMLQRVARTLATRCDPLVISAAPGQELPALGSLGAAWIRVDDPQLDAGPLVGIAAALECALKWGVDLAYLGSCDAAGLSTAHVTHMIDELRRRPEASALVPEDREGRRHPFAAALRCAPMSARAQALIERGEGRLQSLFRGPDVHPVPVSSLPDPRVLAPCNTPAQLCELLDRLDLDEGLLP